MHSALDAQSTATQRTFAGSLQEGTVSRHVSPLVGRSGVVPDHHLDASSVARQSLISIGGQQVKLYMATSTSSSALLNAATSAFPTPAPLKKAPDRDHVACRHPRSTSDFRFPAERLCYAELAWR